MYKPQRRNASFLILKSANDGAYVSVFFPASCSSSCLPAVLLWAYSLCSSPYYWMARLVLREWRLLFAFFGCSRRGASALSFLNHLIFTTPSSRRPPRLSRLGLLPSWPLVPFAATFPAVHSSILIARYSLRCFLSFSPPHAVGALDFAHALFRNLTTPLHVLALGPAFAHTSYSFFQSSPIRLGLHCCAP